MLIHLRVIIRGAEARAAQYDSIRDNPTMKPDDEVVEKVTFNSDGTVKEKVFTKIDGLKDSVKSRFQNQILMIRWLALNRKSRPFGS